MLSVCSIFADILNRRLYSVLFWWIETSQLLIGIKNITTIDVLWDVSTLIVPYLVWHTFGAYNVAIIITYIDVGFALLFRHLGNAKASTRGTTIVEFHVFCVPFCEGFGWFLRWILSLFLVKLGELLWFWMEWLNANLLIYRGVLFRRGADFVNK